MPECFSLVQADQKNVVIEVVKQPEDLLTGMNPKRDSNRDSNQKELVLRLYECYNRRTDVTLSFCDELNNLVACRKKENTDVLIDSINKGNVLAAAECTMLEEEEQELTVRENQISFTMKPYEIKTIKVKILK